MAHQPADGPIGGTLLSRRALLGLALAAGVIGPLIFGAGPAHADSGTDGAEEEEYEIPDDIGSTPWW